MRFQRLVMLRMDVYVAADRYQAKRLDKRRILWRYKLNMLLPVHENCLFAYGAGIWNFTWGNKAWYRFPWRNIHFITWICLVSSIQLLARIANIHVTMPCCVTAYVFVNLSRNQSWVNLLFSVLRDSVLDSILDSLFSILDSRLAQESRIANRVKNRDSQRTVNLLLNGTV